MGLDREDVRFFTLLAAFTVLAFWAIFLAGAFLLAFLTVFFRAVFTAAVRARLGFGGSTIASTLASSSATGHDPIQWTVSLS